MDYTDNGGILENIERYFIAFQKRPQTQLLAHNSQDRGVYSHIMRCKILQNALALMPKRGVRHRGTPDIYSSHHLYITSPKNKRTTHTFLVLQPAPQIIHHMYKHTNNTRIVLWPVWRAQRPN